MKAEIEKGALETELGVQRKAELQSEMQRKTELETRLNSELQVLAIKAEQERQQLALRTKKNTELKAIIKAKEAAIQQLQNSNSQKKNALANEVRETQQRLEQLDKDVTTLSNDASVSWNRLWPLIDKFCSLLSHPPSSLTLTSSFLSLEPRSWK